MRVLGLLFLSLVWASAFSQAKLIKDINPIGTGAGNSSLTVCNGLAFFIGYQPETGYELWRTDGTEEGTYMLKDINSGSVGYTPDNLLPVDSTLYFTAFDGQVTSLWKTDGTVSGTVKIVNVGGTYITNVNGILFFVSTTNEHGNELWRSDGTPEGTYLVKDIYPGSHGSSPYRLTASGSYCYFTAYNEMVGVELWRSDGTESGTVVVKELIPGFNGTCINQIAAFDGGVYFDACTQKANGDDFHAGIWKTDGTESGTILIKELPVTFPHSYEVMDNVLFFESTSDASGVELYRTDGTEAGTSLVMDIYPGPANSYPEYLTNVGENIFFFGMHKSNKTGLFVTDGTESGTQLLQDLTSSDSVYVEKHLIVHNSLVYFFADDEHGVNIWVSDGTKNGTKAVTRESNVLQTSFAILSDKIIFEGFTQEFGIELYSLDMNNVKRESVVIDLFPNPVEGYLEVSYVGEKYMEILTSNGAVVKRVHSDANKVMLDGLNIGIYFLRVETKDGVVFKRFIKNN